MHTKSSLRRVARTYIASLSQDELRQAGAAIAEHLATEETWQAADTVFLFASTTDEIDTRPLVERALIGNKRIAIPRIEAGAMEFAQWDGDYESLQIGPFGIFQPPPAAAVVRPGVATTPLVITPGLAFGRNGSRLGRGGGYYDRYLATYRPWITAVGISLFHLLYDTVPEAPQDVRVDGVVCETGVSGPKL